MSKLRLLDIRKSYKAGNEIAQALKGISLEFRKSEFVSILGPSGCGKTTLLNIIGGLDHYDNGDLVINGISTRNYKDKDWDAYRNNSIGFVFQNYNLISHQTVLQNVEISMTLSGISSSERKRRAKEALKSVGLEGHIKKRPNQLSGGQMQRVAIARALVNNPDIILADEPTGALDTHTSVQVMEILKEISKTKLVIMVTHNRELAERYSSRIVKLLDGEIKSDSNPVQNDEQTESDTPANSKRNKTSMSLFAATSLSFKNLLTKKGRTFLTSFAGSIGIIGVALVLSLSSGLSGYMSNMQSEALSGFPVTVSASEQSVDASTAMMVYGSSDKFDEFTDEDVLYNYDSTENVKTHTNVFTEEFLDYIEEMKTELPDSVNTISYSRGINMNLLAKGEDTVVKVETYSDSAEMSALAGAMGMGSYLQELPDNEEFILSLYDLIGEGSRMPENKNEAVLVVDEYNRISTEFFQMLGITSGEDYKLSDFIGEEIVKVIPNDEYYTKNGNIFTTATANDYETLYNNDESVGLKIVGILRIKEDAESTFLSEGLAYTTALTDYIVNDSESSEIAQAQKDLDYNVLTGTPFTEDAEKEQMLLILGSDTTPIGISIYPVDFESKDSIKDYLDSYNDGKNDEDQIVYSDMAETITSMTQTLINTVSYVLIGFAAISLVVSTIMIAIITYVSVIERTKEIGILRSVGARKKDISRVFNAETLIIGFSAGILGCVLAYALTIPINAIILSLAGISGIASLNPIHALVLVIGSMALTLIAGFIPSRIAAKKDPVEALRTE